MHPALCLLAIPSVRIWQKGGSARTDGWDVLGTTVPKLILSSSVSLPLFSFPLSVTYRPLVSCSGLEAPLGKELQVLPLASRIQQHLGPFVNLYSLIVLHKPVQESPAW